MPTASRLMAAFCMAIVAFIASGLVVPLMPEGTNFGYFPYVNIGLGILVGWTVMGRRAGRGITPAINNGLTGSFVLVLWALFVQSCNEMVRLAMKNRYDDAFEAIAAIFQIGSEWGVLMLTVPMITCLVVGGIIAGLFTEFADHRWP